ncbi:MAG: enoyl-CoA hydratase/isomerase family protein [Pseudoclavibacter sp.]
MSEATNFATVEIDGPGRNLLNPQNIAEIIAGLEAAANDDSVDGIIITGKGDVFCGGLDVASIQAGADPVEFYSSLVALLKLIPTLPKPVVAVVNGDAVATGGAIVASVDYAVSVASAGIGSFEVSIGVWPVVAQVPLIKRLGARASLETIGSGEPFTAARSFEIGLVNRVTDTAQEATAAAEEWLTKAARGRAVVATGRTSVYEFDEMSYEEALDVAMTRVEAAYAK